MAPELSSGSNSDSDVDLDGGGFVINDKDVKKRRRTPTRKTAVTRKTSYVEISDDSDEAVNSDTFANEPTPIKKRKTRQITRPKGNKKSKKIKVESSDDDDDAEFTLSLEDEKESGTTDDEVSFVGSNKIENDGSSTNNAINLSDSESQLSDIPLAEEKPIPPSKKKRKAPAKRKPPKISPYERNTNRLFEQHPFLKEVFPHLQTRDRIKPERAPHPEGMTLKMLPFQLEGLNWLIKQEEGEFKGGILADEMGMGKTIQTIGLFMNDRTQGPNLVVGPTVALMQWKHEIEKHTDGKMKVCLFHGANRATKIKDLLEYDVILTSYSVLESSYRKQQYGFRRKNGLVKEKSPIHNIEFYRVILDEAHNIKDRTSNTSRAANQLNTKKRWCLSGTPLQNRIGELYSLIRYMKLSPFHMYFCTKCACKSEDWKFSNGRHCDICQHSPMLHTNFFNHFMLKQIQKFGLEGSGKESFDRIQLVLGNIMLRRTKLERADDLGLPPRIVEIRRDRFNEEEKDLYQSLYSDSKRKFNDYVAEGVVLNNYANIFTLITRMRQIADHPDLVLKKAGARALSQNIDGVIMCQLCDDEAEEPIESKCRHRFCRMCITEYVESFAGKENKLECPVCHIGLSIDLEQPALEVDEELFSKASIVNRLKSGSHGGEWRSSTKIEALCEELYKLRSDKHTIKSIVFSQFTSMLDLIEWRLKRAGFQTVKLSGSMSPQQRDNTIKYFMENTEVEVFLVSLKAGGVALNLCEASQVFLMDPWWNPSVEWQSMDRVHRIGQKRPIKITRFCIEDSIESKIIELQDKKANMINATINRDEAAINKLTPDDLQFLFLN
ncbi:unnamed protein product [Candida verbasci]|uniref:DNA repair protein RAD16 n=1 Tax=Candida verbasci TaxID=1227364 RepID=A0A9W4TWX5_9ASCO|nr:unnamed protein product [Candida verbasci]